MSDKQWDTALALLLNLSDNCQNQAQTNTVVVQQEKMDRAGFEPTTSAMPMPYPTVCPTFCPTKVEIFARSVGHCLHPSDNAKGMSDNDHRC